MRAVLIHFAAFFAAVLASSIVISLGVAWIAGAATFGDIVGFIPLVSLFVLPPALLGGGAIAACLHVWGRSSVVAYMLSGAALGMVSIVGYSLLLSGQPTTIAKLGVTLALFGGAGAIGALVFWAIAVPRHRPEPAEA